MSVAEVSVDDFDIPGSGKTTTDALADARFNASRMTAGDDQWREYGHSFHVQPTTKGNVVVCTVRLTRLVEWS